MNRATTASQPPVFTRWLGAFVGFYRPGLEEIRQLDPLSKFLYAARSVILVISVQAALIAGLLSISTHGFQPGYFVLVMIGYLVAHMISNLSNDYFGYRRGHDSPDSPRMHYTIHPISSGVLSARALLVGLAILAMIGLAIAAYFIYLRGWLALAIFLSGTGLLFAYDAAPTPLKSVGLGEIAVFLVWGPLMVGGGYAVIVGHASAMPFYVSIPYGLGVMSILLGKHIDQRRFDESKGIVTLPVLLGTRSARFLNCLVVLLMYLVTLGLIAVREVTPFAAIVVVALPRASRAWLTLCRPAPDRAPEGYVGWPLWYHRTCLMHNRLFGWLYIAGLALGAIVAHVR